MTEANPLTEATLARLSRLAQGVGLGKDAISLVDTNEQTYTLEGQIHLTPRFDSKSRSYAGTAKGNGKNKKGFESFQAMADALAKQQQDFTQGKEWTEEARREIEQAPGNGWGMHEAQITLPSRSAIFSATEKCPACAGAGLSPCPQCQGQQHVICPFCYGKKEEDCYNCFATGEDPVHKGQRCPVCHGTRFAPCRYCQATGVMACPTCQGRGGLPCPTCNGTGNLTQETAVSAGANVSFQLANMTQCPSGLLRTLDRVGVPNLVKGFADISVVPPVDPQLEDKTRLVLKAALPYAEMKIRFAGKAALVIAFGKKGYLSGVPAFLDAALTSKLNDLQAVADGHGSIDKLLKIKLISDGLKLVLQRKTNPNDLRRLYPVGLSADMATKIMGLLIKALKNVTRTQRLMTAILGTGLSAGIFYALFLSPLRTQLVASISDKTLLVTEVVTPLLLVAATYLGIEAVAKNALKRRYPDVPIPAGQDIGKIGYVAIAVIFALYAAMRFLPKYLGL